MHALSQAGIWTIEFTVPSAWCDREWAKGVFLHIVSWESSGASAMQMCATLGKCVRHAFPWTVDPGMKGIGSLIGSGLGGMFSPPLKICSRSLWQGHVHQATSEA